MKKSLNFCYQTSLLVNPLGAGRGHHKVIQIFYSLCEIPKNQRSKIDRIQLGKPSKKITVKLGFLSRVGWGGEGGDWGSNSQPTFKQEFLPYLKLIDKK